MAARQQARDAYLAYRREGEYAQSSTGQVCDRFLQALQQANWSETFVAALEAIAGGVRDRSIAEDTELNYATSAELLLLLERL
ncbi:MAG: hypothetical protein HY328_02910 [Chloroflexi bacterium]|nr:hypothetical protein [Chloroflexota bacterium]